MPVEDVGLGELARITGQAVTRIEHIAERLESGQFVRTDIFERSERALVQSVAALEMDAHRLEENKAGKDAVARVSDGLAQVVSKTAYDDLARRVNSLEQSLTWVVRTVGAVIILAILALVITQGGGKP